MKKVRKMAAAVQSHVMEYSEELLHDIDQSFIDRIDVISDQLPDNYSILNFLKRVSPVEEAGMSDLSFMCVENNHPFQNSV